MSARVAVYYAPEADDPLSAAGNAWLGRDPETGAPLVQPDVPGIAAVTADPRLYGFHATLKPPMRLRYGATFEAVTEAAQRLAEATPPFTLPPLAVADLSGFLALRETAPCPALQALADACVAGLDPFRAPQTEDDLARRRRPGLSPEQDAMLQRWGYPHVFRTWRFHMTLTQRLDEAGHAAFRPAAEAHFAAAPARPRRVGSICLFTQAGFGVPFRLAVRLRLRG